MKVSDLTDTTAEMLRSAGAFAHDLVHPTVRLGVTGLARAGKTVFISSLVHNLCAGGRLPFFEPVVQGRIRRAYLEPQPDDAVPRFDYEGHLAELTGAQPRWPESTRRLSQLRVTLDYEPWSMLKRRFGHNRLHIDIVDYPGEWLLDLPLLHLGYEDWAGRSLALSREGERETLARAWHEHLERLDPTAPAEERIAVRSAELFTAYLKECRRDPYALSIVPPGRFLMPGELAGSPALTFGPLALPGPGPAPPGSLWAMMARRYESYKAHVVEPFFCDHFARLDRQIVLVDALAALNAGPDAVHDLERALSEILQCFRPGAKSWLAGVLRRRIDRIVFAATKADHLHHTSHDRLEAILARLTQRAIRRAAFAGADVEVIAMAAVRATREGTARHGGETLPCIVGFPVAGERIDGRTFDGEQEFAVFPGDLPEDPELVFAGPGDEAAAGTGLSFVRFRPPRIESPAAGTSPALPHIRLDRALDFLLGDRLA